MAENASVAQGGGESPPIKPDTNPKRTGRKRKRKRRGSVMYRTWLYFIAMTVAMLALLKVGGLGHERRRIRPQTFVGRTPEMVAV